MEGKDMTKDPVPDQESNSLMPETPEPDASDQTGDDEPLERLEIETTANGGYVVTCYHAASDDKGEPAWSKPQKYAVSSREELDQILDDKLGTPDESQAGADHVGAPSAGAGAASGAAY